MRVDVTGDQGLTWTTAKLEQGKEPSSRHYGWTLWTAEVPVQKGVKEVFSELIFTMFRFINTILTV